jgi:hypothetical protein
MTKACQVGVTDDTPRQHDSDAFLTHERPNPRLCCAVLVTFRSSAHTDLEPSPMLLCCAVIVDCAAL